MEDLDSQELFRALKAMKEDTWEPIGGVYDDDHLDESGESGDESEEEEDDEGGRERGKGKSKRADGDDEEEASRPKKRREGQRKKEVLDAKFVTKVKRKLVIIKKKDQIQKYTRVKVVLQDIGQIVIQKNVLSVPKVFIPAL